MPDCGICNDKAEVMGMVKEIEELKSQLVYQKVITEDFFFQNKILEEKLAKAVKVIEYLYPQVDRMFKDIPEGLSPTFYHTLSYEEEMKVRNKLDGFEKFLAEIKEKEAE